MRRASAAAYLTIIASTWASTHTASGQERLTFGANAVFYGDNTEFRNPFREGETIFGAAVRLDGRVEITQSVALTVGVFGNQRFGSADAFEVVRPMAALTVRGKRSAFVFGTLPGPFGDGTPQPDRPIPAGPDRLGPHRLLPPIQREVLTFERPYEAGLQWTFQGSRLDHEAWLHWQRLNTAAHRERIDAGARSAWRVAGPVALPFQAHVVHEGGQLFASGPVRDSLAVASGVAFSTARRGAPSSATEQAEPSGAPVFSLELLGLWSRDTPDRESPNPSRDGGAFFGRAAVAGSGWRGHLIMFRGNDYVKDEGDANYLSLRRDGSRYRGVRDYAEAGLTRTFVLAPGARLEAAFRMHRVERQYEYSYRVLAVASVRTKNKTKAAGEPGNR